MTDPIADMLTRIRNSIGVGKNEVVLSHSNVKEGIAKLLVKKGFIESVKTDEKVAGKKLIIITIYSPLSSAKITQITRLSKPGRRYYVGSHDIPTVKSGRGIIIMSTSKGLMTGDEAIKQGVGGELICKVY